MTFPLGPTLTDPWSDNVLVNAAAMKVNTTDKLNALAAALGAKTARVRCAFTLTTTVVPTASVKGIPVGTITSQEGGTFSIVSGTLSTAGGGPAAVNGLFMPSDGVFMVRVYGTWSAVQTARAILDVIPTFTGDGGQLVRHPSGYGEDKWVLTGYFTTKGGANQLILFAAYQTSGVSSTLSAMVGEIVKVSD